MNKFYFYVLFFLFLLSKSSFAKESFNQQTIIPHLYTLSTITNVDSITDEEAIKFIRKIVKKKDTKVYQVAWFSSKKNAQKNLLLVGEYTEGKNIFLMRPRNDTEAIWLEYALGYPTSPSELCRAYLKNGILADDNFQEKIVIFKAQVTEIAKGAFNQPYVFFTSETDQRTGLTCYFQADDPSLRKIIKGSTIIVRGKVKGFLMQDVILEKCTILSIVS